jgi:hypothetical protein
MGCGTSRDAAVEAAPQGGRQTSSLTSSSSAAAAAGSSEAAGLLSARVDATIGALQSELTEVCWPS